MEVIKCALTGLPTSSPILCKPNGLVYDKALISNHLEINGGKCPRTGVDLNLDEDFIEIICNKGPSVDEIETSTTPLTKLNNVSTEIEEKIEESQKMKTTITNLKKTLNKKLTEHQAALKLIKKLENERNEARKLYHQTLLSLGMQESVVTQIKEEAIKTSQTSMEIIQSEIKVEALRLNKLRKEKNKLSLKEKYDLDTKNFKELITGLNISNKKQILQFEKSKFICFVFESSITLVNKTDSTKIDINIEGIKNLQNFVSNDFWTDSESIGFLGIDQITSEVLGMVINIKEKSSKIVFRRKLSDSRFIKLVKHPLNHFVIAIAENKSIWILDLKRENLVKLFEENRNQLEQAQIENAEIHPDGKLLVLLLKNGVIIFVDTTSREIVLDLKLSNGVSKIHKIRKTFLIEKKLCYLLQKMDII